MDENAEISLKTSGSSTTFTISFEDDNDNSDLIKQKRIIKTANMFTKRHYRTLSLPVVNNSFYAKNISNNKYGCEAIINCDEKKINNCSLKNNKLKSIAMNDCAQSYSEDIEQSDDVCSSSHEDSTNPSISSEIKDIDTSETDSEGGTYTIDKNNEQVEHARKSIDQVFGISVDTDQQKYPEEAFDKKSRMIDEWMKQSASVMSIPIVSSKISESDVKIRNKIRTSKIPYPIEKCRELGSTNSLNSVNSKKNHENYECSIDEESRNTLTSTNINNQETDTEQYLRETESIVTALQKRIKSDVRLLHSNDRFKNRVNGQCEKESPSNKMTNTRFNRAFSLRRDRLKKPSSPVVGTTIPVRSKTFVGTNLNKSLSQEGSPSLKNVCNIKRNNSFCRDLVKNDSSNTPKTKLPSKLKNEGNKKPNSMSPQEIELHNWKRRKSYDPMKAVAEEKKKKSLAAVNATSSSSSSFRKKEFSSLEENDNLTTKIIRSASFHGIRSKNGYEPESRDEKSIDRNSSNRSVSSYFISSNDDTAEYENDIEDQWVVPKPPSTSLQNTPPESISSRLSLLSNTASHSSVLLLSSSVFSKIDLNTISKVTQLSYKIKDTIFVLSDALNGKKEAPSQTADHSKSHFSPRFSANIIEDSNELTHDNDSIEEKNNDLEKNDNDISPQCQLNITLNNLQEVYQAVKSTRGL